MVKERMDLLELLRKGGMDGDVDFLREALRVLVEGIMDAEVSSRIGAEYGERSPLGLGDDGGERFLHPHRLGVVLCVRPPDQLPRFLIDTKNCGTRGRLA